MVKTILPRLKPSSLYSDINEGYRETIVMAGENSYLPVMRYKQKYALLGRDPDAVPKNVLSEKWSEMDISTASSLWINLATPTCNSPRPYITAVTRNRPEIATYLINLDGLYDLRYLDDWLFRCAVIGSYWKLVKSLISKGVPANASDNVAIKKAARKKNDEMVQYLLEHGAQL